ncbi:MFS transporter [Burkholderiaceae bacterium FT117]|uniref:MFS transporter n=1 Tax=Zeimonas sediminis TaxID=2944268 RepID=UPI002342D3AF|nr:MFS transporter [Zeimonas sediminis]MCM5570501.1 MFS transporter [Zeimonas sediminis]
MTQSDRTLFWLAAASFASMASMRICDPMLPALADDFGTTAASTAGVVTLYTIGYGFSQLAHGPLGDRIGKARYIAGAAMAAALASLLCALAPGLAMLEAARLVTGSMAAAIIPLSMAWVGDTVPYAQRQATLARFLNGTILGLILGQALGGLLADTLGWRSAFVLLAAIFATAGWKLRAVVRAGAAASAQAATEGPEASGGAAARATPDAAGSSAVQPPPGAGASSVPSGALARYAVVLRSAWARAILAIVAIEGLFAFGALAFIPTSLHERAGIPIWLAGAIVGSFGFGGFAYTLNAGRLLRRFGEKGLALAGGLVLAAGFGLVAAAPGFVPGVIACVLIGLGYQMLHNTLQTHATQMAPSVRGTAVALFAMCLFIGQSAGVTLAASAVPAAGFAPVFVATALGLAATGAVFAWLLQRRAAAH